MKKLTLVLTAATALISAPALAADLRRPPPPAPVVAPLFTWTGFYIGGHVGGGFGEKDWDFVNVGGIPLLPPFPTTSHDVSGLLAGGQVGFNWQTGMFVFGVEGEASWADINGSSTCPNPAASCESNIDWLASITGRVGVAFDRALLYVKGGWAWAGDRHFVTFGNIFDEETGDVTRSGWTIGGGLEYSFAPNWSAKIEYMFTDFGSEDRDFRRVAAGTFVETAAINQTLSTVKFGINYRFGFGPVGPVMANY